MDVAFDTETTGLDWVGGDRPFMCQWAEETGRQYHALMGPADPADEYLQGSRRELREALDRASRIVGHNLAFDVHMARAGGVTDLRGRRLADTMHLARIVAPERRNALAEDEGGHAAQRGYHLKDLATAYVDPNAADGEAKLERLAEQHGFKLKAKPDQQGYRPAAFFELWKLEPESMEYYGREDVRLTLALLGELEGRLDERTARVWELEQAVLPHVVHAEELGVRVDRDRVPEVARDYEIELDVLMNELDGTLGEGWDDNNAHLAEALIDAGVPLTELTDSGKHLATNKWALERLADDYPIVGQIQEKRTIERFLNTYIKAIEDKDVVHPKFWQIGTWTGRMSSSEPNMQNVPVRAGQTMRDLFIPTPGYAFVAFDYEQIEFRLLCYYLNNKPLIERMEDADWDPFAWLAAKVHGGDEANYRKGTAGESQRSDCKNTTYAVQYGAGGKRIMRMLHLASEADGRAYAKMIKDNLPGFKQLNRRIEKQIYGPALDNELRSLPFGRPDWKEQREAVIDHYMEETGRTYGVVNTVFGRRQTIPLKKAYTGLSGLIQGGAADIFKQGLVNAAPAAAGIGASAVLFIHDELVFECPTENVEELIAVVEPAMIEAAGEVRPRMAVEHGVGYNTFGECK